jgi:hypothetical protein
VTSSTVIRSEHETTHTITQRLQIFGPVRGSTEFPTVGTHSTPHKGRHWLISRPCLHLVVRALALLALPTSEHVCCCHLRNASLRLLEHVLPAGQSCASQWPHPGACQVAGQVQTEQYMRSPTISANTLRSAKLSATPCSTRLHLVCDTRCLGMLADTTARRDRSPCVVHKVRHMLVLSRRAVVSASMPEHHSGAAPPLDGNAQD